MLRTWLTRLALLTLAVAVLAAGVLAGRSPAGVDWRRVRAVALESDDWGLCGFVPTPTALAGLDSVALAPGEFPPVYWGSTLEDSVSVARLAGVLARHRGRDGEAAVLQPNYILSSITYEAVASAQDTTWQWQERDLPQTPSDYPRPGLWTAVHQAMRAGVMHPELHGRYHYDPAIRERASLADANARAAAMRQVLLFPGSERAWELGPWRATADLARELDHGLAVFTNLFGQPPRSVIAPDYHWDDRCERLWLSRGLRIIQAKREQRSASFRGTAGRLRKLLGRTLARQLRWDRTYLERNCRLETAQNRDPAAVVTACTQAVRRAWQRGEPAIVETHRVNFVHTDTTIAAEGREGLQRLLGDLDDAPVYLVDAEIAGLMRRGTSWCRRGDVIIVRNFTRSRKLVVVPAMPTAPAGAAGPAARARVVSLGPGQTRRLPF